MLLVCCTFRMILLVKSSLRGWALQSGSKITACCPRASDIPETKQRHTHRMHDGYLMGLRISHKSVYRKPDCAIDVDQGHGKAETRVNTIVLKTQLDCIQDFRPYTFRIQETMSIFPFPLHGHCNNQDAAVRRSRPRSSISSLLIMYKPVRGRHKAQRHTTYQSSRGSASDAS